MLYVMGLVALPNVCQPRRSHAALVLLLGALACARTGLYPGEAEDLGAEGPGGSGGAHGNATAGANTQGGALQALAGAAGTAGTPPLVTAGAPPVTHPTPPECEPAAETCNGRDDDCNGAVDDLPAQACDGGGFRFCVAGRLSECPRRCEVCVAGSVRVCQNSFCSFWGEQECAADGQGFGHCREAEPPPECASIAKKLHESRELEQCCVDNGYCCVDDFDLDQDGNRREMLGACRDISCQ